MTLADRRHRLAWGISAAATIIWLAVVAVAGLFERVVNNWESAATMLFGSFLAGSSPEGGGAVAFPVFTKALHVSAPVARSFGLSIQAVGMGVATLAILLFRRKIHRRAAVVGSIGALVGFAVATVFFGEHSELFWPSTISAPWIKATFSIVLATTSLLMVRHLRHGDHHDAPLQWNQRIDAALLVAALAGGFVSALGGTGANIVVFLFLVVIVDENPKVALPTAIIVMTVVSVAGLIVYGIVDGQLDVEVTGDLVTSVGGTSTALDAGRADLLGLWLAAVPVVVWGAPLGSLAASMIPERRLVQFVALLAATEVLTTFILVSELRTNRALLAYLVVGLIALPAGLIGLARSRHTLLAA